MNVREPDFDSRPGASGAAAGAPGDPSASGRGSADDRQRPKIPRDADAVVDELVGDDLDWQRLVRTYPTSAFAVAVAGGCWLGYRHGRAILAAVTGYMASEAARRVNEFLGEEAL